MHKRVCRLAAYLVEQAPLHLLVLLHVLPAHLELLPARELLLAHAIDALQLHLLLEAQVLLELQCPILDERLINLELELVARLLHAAPALLHDLLLELVQLAPLHSIVIILYWTFSYTF